MTASIPPSATSARTSAGTTALDDLAVRPFHEADAPQRARMLSRLADSELIVALAADPAGDTVDLQIFPLDGGRVALACDTEDRLSGFLGGVTPYAAMPGRVLAEILRLERAGLLVNPGQPSEMLLDDAMLDWLTGALSAAPQSGDARLRLSAPAAPVVEALAEPLAQRLLDMRGLIAGAGLASAASGSDAGAAHVVLIAGADIAHQPAIAKALSEALAFLPEQQGGVDISFTAAALPAGILRFDLTPPPEPDPAPRPKGPPILR